MNGADKLFRSSAVLILGRLHALTYIEQAKGNQQIDFLLNVMLERSSLSAWTYFDWSWVFYLAFSCHFCQKISFFWIPLSIIDDYWLFFFPIVSYFFCLKKIYKKYTVKMMVS